MGRRSLVVQLPLQQNGLLSLGGELVCAGAHFACPHSERLPSGLGSVAFEICNWLERYERGLYEKFCCFTQGEFKGTLCVYFWFLFIFSSSTSEPPSSSPRYHPEYQLQYHRGSSAGQLDTAIQRISSRSFSKVFKAFPKGHLKVLAAKTTSEPVRDYLKIKLKDKIQQNNISVLYDRPEFERSIASSTSEVQLKVRLRIFVFVKSQDSYLPGIQKLFDLLI